MLSREDKDKRITFVLTPVRVGYFKLVIFGMPKPKQKGKWRLPLIATFLIDCKLTRFVYRSQSRLTILSRMFIPAFIRQNLNKLKHRAIEVIPTSCVNEN